MPKKYSPDLRIKELENLFLNLAHLPEGASNSDLGGMWTLRELAEKISGVFDLDRTISERTIKNDLKKMEQLGAPLDSKMIQLASTNIDSLKNVNKLVHFYYDTKISIYNNNNLDEKDLDSLRTIISMLSQFKGFKDFEDITDLIDRLQKKATRNGTPNIIFETIDDLIGIDKIDEIATSIKEKATLEIRYQPYFESEILELIIYPHQLRQFNNRWFVLAGTLNKNEIGIYGLDRILSTNSLYSKTFKHENKLLIKNYFKDIIGVTNYTDREIEEITFEVFGNRAKYVISKPWHSSQKKNKIKETPNSVIFKINVKINPELEALILSFGKDIKVIAPLQLKNSIAKKLEQASNFYS